jgi:hypothetical protein
MNNTTSSYVDLLSTTSSGPYEITNANWLSIVFSDNLYINFLIGLSLNSLILIISLKKKREPDQTYRIIIRYQVVFAIVEDIGKLLQEFLLVDLLSGKLIDTI